MFRILKPQDDPSRANQIVDMVRNGDILALYAVCGPLLLPCLDLPWPALLVIGAAAIALPDVVWFGVAFPSGFEAADQITQALQIYGGGGSLSILSFRWHESWALIVPWLIAFLPPDGRIDVLGNGGVA